MFMESGKVENQLESTGKIAPSDVASQAGNIPCSPYFYISLTMMVLGTQLFVAGFLGELISRNAQGRNDYHIEKEF